ncbi:MAG TPA: DUF4157 domain-containing protein [Methanosarcina sp.]|nr:DUF4157 domain-containing protein [Methanosarcina sp.]
MPEHQQTQQSIESKTTFQKQAPPIIQTPISNPMAIIQRARINPKSLTHADVMQLQRTIGNRAVGRLFSEIGLIPSTAKQAPPIQRQELVQRQEIPDEEEPLQGKITETVQRQEIPEEDEPLQGKFENNPGQVTCPSCMQRQEIPEEEGTLQGKLIEPIQRQEPEEGEKLQIKSVVQKQEKPEEEEPLQGKMIGTIQRQETPEEEEPLQTKRENNTGIPDKLKAGVENLSGMDMSDVRVHYNSSKPAEVGALAYTQGTNIHVAPGQERHLPHEAWHVVQQKQGRVEPTMQAKGVSINNDSALEREADVMGAKALQIIRSEQVATSARSLQRRKRAAFLFPSFQRVSLSNAIIQRRVGFEFEENQWRAWKSTYLGWSYRPAKRKEVLHRGPNYELQADDTLGADQPTLEFVTDPFPPTPAGLGNLIDTMADIRHVMAIIGPFHGRDETEGRFVQANEHNFSEAGVLLSRGHSRGMFKIQATQGVSLEDIPKFMEYFGSNVPAEGAAETANRNRSRELMRGTNIPGPQSIVMGIAPSLAQTAVNRLAVSPHLLPAAQAFFVGGGNTQRVVGFLAQLILYVKMLSACQPNWLKYSLPLLGRTDFAAMFMQLPPNQRTSLSNNSGQALIDAVVHAANSVQLIPNQHGGGHYDVAFGPNVALIRNYQPPGFSLPVIQSLTIGAWLRGISGNPPVDFLSIGNIDTWLRQNENLWWFQRSSRTGLFESVASMGNQTDVPERPGTSNLIIIENRGIAPANGPYNNYYGAGAPGQMNPDEMTQAAKDYLQFFINLNANPANPGAFPQVP